MIIGRELALGPFPLRVEVYYTLFGSDHFGQQVRAMHLAKLLVGIKVPPQRIMDAGCSGGLHCFYLARRYPSAQVLGVDLESSSLRKAEVIRQRLGKLGRRIMLQKADLTILRTDTQLFDLVCCIDVLEHTADDITVLNNLRSVLAEKGLLLLHVPRRVELNRYVLSGFPVPKMSEGHIREYTEVKILSKVKRAGYEIQEIRYTFGWPGSLARELYYTLEKIPSLLMRAVLKRVMAPFLLLLAYGDTLTKNEARHQGLFISACPIRAKEA